MKLGYLDGEGCPLISEAGFGHSQEERELQAPQFSPSLLHNTGVRASQRPGVPGTAEAVGDGQAVPRASCPRTWGPGTVKPGGFEVSKVPFHLFPASPPFCVADCLLLGIEHQPQEASEDTRFIHWAQDLPALSPVPCPQWEGRPGLQEGGGPG